MGNLDDTRPKPKEEDLKLALEALEESRYKFCIFIDCFKKYLKKGGLFDEEQKV